ncbi:acetyltransferase domain-containing protein [Xylariaceae sp. FL0804]|nr:acetyltransferase domain-containing protein [Xylariaceae sp. FL0804]
MPAHPPVHMTRVRTTLPAVPLPPNADRAPIRTTRLVLRPIAPADLDGIHAMRTQEEVMIWTRRGRPNRDRAETQQFMDRFLPPNDGRTYEVAICLASTGELIGTGGMHTWVGAGGWPEVGYMLRHEFWGRGYASEFLAALAAGYGRLTREEVVLDVAAESVGLPPPPPPPPPTTTKMTGEGEGGGGLDEEEEKEADEQGQGLGLPPTVPEMLWANFDATNGASGRVLEKTGFRNVVRWAEPDIREGYEGKEVALEAWALPVSTSG